MNPLTTEIENLRQELQEERARRLQAEHRYADLMRVRHENPTSIMHFSASGELLSANAASLQIVNALRDQEEEPFLRDLIRLAQESFLSQKRLTDEQEFRGRQYHCSYRPVKNKAYVQVCLADITDQKATEASLQETRILLEKIFHTTPDILYVYDLVENRNVFSNHRIEQLLGYSPEDVKEMGNDVLPRMIHPDDLTQVTADFEAMKLARDGEIKESRWRVIHQDGTCLWLHNRSTCFKRTADGKVCQIMASAVDITGQVRLEQQLQEQKAFYETILSCLPADIAVFDKDYRYRYINPLAVKDEAVRAWMIGKDNYEYCDYRGKDRSLADGRRAVLDTLAATNQIQEWEEKFISAEGEESFMLRRAAPVLDENGELLYIIGSGIDITARKRDEERLRLFESVVKTVKDAIMITDTQTGLNGPRVVFVNPAFSQISGFEPEEIIGQSPRLLQTPETDPIALQTIQAALGKWAPVEVEMINYRKDGTGYWANISFTPVFDGQGQCTHLVSVQRDISDRKKAEEEIRQSAAKNRAILNAIPDLMYLLSFDGTITDLKESSAEMFLPTTEEIIGANLLKLLPKDLATKLSGYMEQVLQTGAMQVFDHALLQDQRRCFFEFRLLPYQENELLLLSRNISLQKESLLELQEQKQFIRQVIDTSPSYVFVKDGNGRFILANQAMANLLGASLETINEWAFSNQEETEQFNRDDRQVIETLKELNKEEIFTKPSGEKAWMSTIKKPMRRADGTVQVLGISTDITEMKRAKEELIKREALYRLVSENSQDIICLHDLSGQYLYCSSSMEAILGYTPADMIGLSPYPFIHPDDLAVVEEAHFSLLNQKSTVTQSLRFLNKSGKYVWLESILKSVTDETGKVIHLQSSSRDITERVKAEEKIKKSEKQYRNLINYSQAIICSHDPEGKILSFNPSLQKILGYPEHEILNRNLLDFIPASHKRGANSYLVYLQKSNNYSGITCIINRAGELKYLLMQAYKVEEAGISPYIIAFAQDITDRLLAEQELRKAKIAAEESVRVKERFLANMSHEIRTPINGVIGMTGLLAKTPLDEAQQLYVKNIRTSGQNLLMIINDILDVAKIGSGKVVLEKLPFILNETIRDTHQSLDFMAKEKGLSFDLDLVPLDNPEVIGDPYRLNQIILNLLSNALKFTSRGSITLSTRILSETESAVTLEFSVRDTGIGIPQEKQEAIFEDFTQAHASTTRQYGGTGLGLTICKSLVKQQGGRLWVESEPDKGSTFRFTLPFGKAPAALAGASPLPAERHPLPGQVRVLLAEDNEMNQLLARTILQGRGLQVDTAHNGKEAVALAGQRDYDLVLMDIQMPLLGGMEATRQIRQLSDPNRSTVPIIALTANAFKEDEEKYRAAGMDDYLSKPFEEEDLFRKISENLQRRHPLRPSEQAETEVPVKAPEPSEAAESNLPQQLLDLTHLRKMCAGNKEFLTEMLQLFLDTAPAYLRELKLRQEEGNWEAIGKIAHRLKPMMDTMGILVLKEEIRALEKNGLKEIHLEEIPLLIDRLDTGMDKVMEKVKEELSRI